MVNYTQKAGDYLINNARLGKTNTKQYKTILDFYSKQPDKDTSLLNKISPAPVKEKQQFNPLQQAIAGNVPLFDSGIKITDKPSVDTPPLTALREKTGDFFRDFRATNPIMGVLGLDYPAISEISPTGETTAVKKFVKPAIQVKDTALFSGVLKSDQEMQKSFNKDLSGFTSKDGSRKYEFTPNMSLNKKMEMIDKFDGRTLVFADGQTQNIEFEKTKINTILGEKTLDKPVSFLEAEKIKADTSFFSTSTPTELLTYALLNPDSKLYSNIAPKFTNIPIFGDVFPYGSKRIDNLLDSLDENLKGDPKIAAFLAQEVGSGRLGRRKLSSRFTNLLQAGGSGLLFLYGEGTQFLKDSLNKLPQFEIDTFGGLETPEQREAFLTRYFPSMAKDFHMYIQSRGINDISLEDAEAILYFDNNVVERALGIGVEGLIPGTALARITAGMSAATGKAFTGYLKQYGNKFESLDEAVEGFVTNKFVTNKYGELIGPRKKFFPKFREGLQRGRLANTVQMWQSTLPLKKRTEYKSAVQARDSILSKIASEQPTAGSQRARDLNRQLFQANEKIVAAEAFSNVAPFLRELGMAEARVVLYGAAGGQVAQEFNFDPVFGEIFGVVHGGIIAPIADNIPYLKHAFILNPDSTVKKAYDMAHYHTLYALERIPGSGFSPGDLLSESINFASQKGLEQFTDILARSDPELIQSVTQRVSLLNKYKKRLISKGMPEKTFNMTLAKLTGLAVLEAFDATYGNAISAAETLTVKGMNDLQEGSAIRKRLVTELRTLMDDLAPQTMDPEMGSDLAVFTTQIENGIKAQETKIKTINGLIAQAASNKQAIIMTNYLSGIKLGDTKKQDIQVMIDELYGLTQVKLGPDATAEQLYKETLSISYTLERQIKNEVDDLIKSFNSKENRDIFTNELFKIPKIQKLLKKEITNVDSAVTSYATRTRIAKNKITKRVVSDRINKLLEVSMEARRGEIAQRGSVPFSNINKKYENATGNATEFFIDILSAELDPSRPLQGMVKDGISSGDLSSLSKSFSRKASELFDEYNFPREAMQAEVKGKTGFDPKKDSHLLYHIMTDPSSEFYEDGKDLAVEINFEDMYKLSSAISRKAFDYSSTKTGIPAGSVSATYQNLTARANNIFDNFVTQTGVDANGQPIFESLPELRTDVENLKQFYRENVANVLYSENSLFMEWLPADRSATLSQLDPTGLSYKKPSSRWINMNEIAEGDADVFKDKLSRAFGELQDGEYKVDTYKYKGLSAVLDFKIKEWIQEQRVAGKTIDEVNDGIKNIANTFHVRQNDFLVDPNDYVGSNGFFSLGQQRLRHKDIDIEAKKAETIIDDAFNGQIKPIREQVEREEKNLLALRKLIGEEMGETGSIGTEEDFFNLIVGNKVRGEEVLERFKNVFDGTPEEFEDVTRKILSQYIGDQVYSKTAMKITGIKDAGTIEVFDINFDKLEEILTTNPATLEKVLGTEHYETLKDIASYMKLYDAKYNQSRTALTSVPRALSVESWISRMYSINREVVSPRYVATEAAVQQFRLRNMKLLQAIIQDKEVAQLFGEMIETGRPLSPEKNKRFFNALLVATARYGSQEDYSAPDLYQIPMEGVKFKVQEKYGKELKFLGIID
tara:strand:+ start:5805 stop:10673 length:4869 start_codon:yes stop_codon:yes gene_type:complete